MKRYYAILNNTLHIFGVKSERDEFVEKEQAQVTTSKVAYKKYTFICNGKRLFNGKVFPHDVLNEDYSFTSVLL